MHVITVSLSSAKIRIAAAVFMGALLVGGSFYLKSQQPPVAAAGDVESAPAFGVRKHIPVVDSNLDGVPDWQAALVDGDPIYLDASSTEAYVPPDTVTGQMNYRFSQDVAVLGVYGLLPDATDELIEGAIKETEERTAERIYTEKDLANIVTTKNIEALETYGNLVAGTFFDYFKLDENEFDVFARMTTDHNPKHIEKLKAIDSQYQDVINFLLSMQVPEQYVFEHLAFLNSVSALKHDVYAMQLFFDDPIFTAARYRRYAEDFLMMKSSINALYDALYLDEGITFADNSTLRVLVDSLNAYE